MNTRTVLLAALFASCVHSLVVGTNNSPGQGLTGEPSTSYRKEKSSPLTVRSFQASEGRKGDTSLRFKPEIGGALLSPAYDAQNALPSSSLAEVLEPTANRTVCGDGFCCCSNTAAVCSGQGLAYIPEFPSNITELDFSNNSLGDIDANTFRNISHLTILNLEQNDVSTVHPEAFVNMTKLKELYLGHNNLSDFEALMIALNQSTQLEVLHVEDNYIRRVNLNVLLNLKNVSLYDNFVSSLEIGPTGDIGLEYLNLGANSLSEFPDFCYKNDTSRSHAPSLWNLNVEWNKIGEMDPQSPRCFPNLTRLNMEGNSIYHIRSNFLQGFPKLERLSLRFCMARMIDSHAFNHSNIQHLDVSENLWFFDKVQGRWIDSGLFLDMPHLKSINMSWTVFRYSENPERDQVLSSLSHVETFILEGTGLSFIPEIILSSFTCLTNLSFSKNEIAFLPDNSFENLTSLRVLDISKNHLTTISQKLLEGMLSRDNVKLDLSGNPFSCSCDSLWFLGLYTNDAKNTAGHIFIDTNGYVCSNPEDQNGKRLEQVGITQRTCMFSYATYVAILFVSIFTTVALIVVSVVYRYRWRLRFLLYTLQHRLTRERQMGPARPPKYDVFVSYDSRDNNWVLRVLRKELEDRRGLKLCLHERDFTPGRYISDNIIEKMQQSAAILPVMSNAFLQSDWCRFELFVAIKSGLAHARRRVPLVPILLETLDRAAVDSFVCTLLNTTTYLAWPRVEGEGAVGGGVRGEGEGETAEERRRFWVTLCAVIASSTGRELRQFPLDG